MVLLPSVPITDLCGSLEREVRSRNQHPLVSMHISTPASAIAGCRTEPVGR